MQSQEFTSVSVRRIQRFCIAGMAAIALAACIGWVTGWRVLASTRPMYIPTSPNTALCFALLAVALGCLSSRRDGAWRRRVGVAAVCAAVPVLIALARVVEYSDELRSGGGPLVLRGAERDAWPGAGREDVALFRDPVRGLGPDDRAADPEAIRALGPRRRGDGGVGGDRDGRDLPAGVPVRCAAALRRQDDPDGAEYGARLCLSGGGDRRRGRRWGISAPPVPRPIGACAAAPRVSPVRRWGWPSPSPG